MPRLLMFDPEPRLNPVACSPLSAATDASFFA
jgi:hypothetical protein